MMRFAIAPWGETIAELVQAAQAAEEAGFERAWFEELHRSAFVQATAAAAATSEIGIGTAIALAFVRSPMTTALTALDLDDLSNGRFALGVGAGVRRLNEEWHGAAYDHPVARLRETVELIRQFGQRSHLGETIQFEGELVQARIRGYRRPFAPVRPDVPVYIGAMGPLMQRLTGEIADGWIAHELCSPRYLIDQAIPNLKEGLRRGGRDRASLQIVGSACCVVDSDGRRARRVAAGQVAFYATVKSYQPFFEFHDFGDVIPVVRERFAARDTEGMRAACPDELVDAMTIAGEPDQVRERLAAYEGLVDEIKLSPPTQFASEEVTRAAQARLIELFGGN